jgi:HNH endonuclease
MSRYRCTVCHDYFAPPPYRRLGIVSVCSETCLSQLARRGPRPPKNPDIPETTRAHVRARDRHRCRYCGRTHSLHEHHIRYRSQGVDHSPDNLIVLCYEHHDLVHGDKGRWQPVCLAYIAELREGRQRYLGDIDRQINPSPPAGSDAHHDPTADP